MAWSTVTPPGVARASTPLSGPRWRRRSRLAVLSDVPVSDEQLRDPRYSLARWPALDAAVRRAEG